MVDTFDSHTVTITAPPSNAVAITPDDTTDLPFASRAIYVGTAGDLRVQTLGGQDVTYVGVSGTKVVRVTRIFATGTTAANIICEW